MIGSIQSCYHPETLVLNGTGCGSQSEAMMSLNDPRARKMMNILEAQTNKGIKNDRFGTIGIKELSELTVDSEEWNQFQTTTWEGPQIITPEERQLFISSAKQVLKPENAKLLNEVNGGDGFFDDDITKWLEKENQAEIARSPLPIKPGDPNAVKLSRNLQLIYGTADGKKLIDKVVQNGGSIGTSAAWPNASGSQISVRDENMDVLVHELVHAATTQDGDSLVEEGVGTAIAVRTVNEIAAKNPGIDVGPRYFGADPTFAYFWGRDHNPAEASLPDSNNILTSLAEIGIFYEIPPGGPPIGGEDGRQVAA